MDKFDDVFDTHVSYPDQIAELQIKIDSLEATLASAVENCESWMEEALKGRETIQALSSREQNLLLRMNQAIFFLHDEFQNEGFIKERLNRLDRSVGRVFASHGRSAKVFGDLMATDEFGNQIYAQHMDMGDDTDD
jgi:hypothetical protein